MAAGTATGTAPGSERATLRRKACIRGVPDAGCLTHMTVPFTVFDAVNGTVMWVKWRGGLPLGAHVQYSQHCSTSVRASVRASVTGHVGGFSIRSCQASTLDDR